MQYQICVGSHNAKVLQTTRLTTLSSKVPEQLNLLCNT